MDLFSSILKMNSFYDDLISNYVTGQYPRAGNDIVNPIIQRKSRLWARFI